MGLTGHHNKREADGFSCSNGRAGGGKARGSQQHGVCSVPSGPTCWATSGFGPSSRRRRAKLAAVLKLRSLKKRFRAVRNTSTMWTGCRLQWVKVSLGNFFLSVSMVRPTMYSLQMQRDGQQDDPEALDGLLEAPGRRQLVAVLQAGDEVGEAQAHSGQALLCATAGQRRQPQVTGAASGQRLHEQRLVGLEVHNSHLVVEQLGSTRRTVNAVNVMQHVVPSERLRLNATNVPQEAREDGCPYPHRGLEGAGQDVVHRQLGVVAPHLRGTRSFSGRDEEAVLRSSACTGRQVLTETQEKPRVDGRRRLQQLSLGVDLGDLGHDTASGEEAQERRSRRRGAGEEAQERRSRRGGAGEEEQERRSRRGGAGQSGGRKGARLTASFSGSKVSFRAAASSSSPWVAAVR
ncbi:hypothetical protein EYF80_057506 [Liparis tanakae]|uniref:Uncharacterized protein n=1 Tax=Liparis tanakae TaxID=230148 RepID=A0A4Z2EU12_9TELE|nr:hypothetical protein EYF80_057506 [Liparis tanakae]